MATKRKRNRLAGVPLFLTKTDLATALGNVDTGTIDEWVQSGTVPPPHSAPGQRTALWRRSDLEEYWRTGRWPDEAFLIGRGEVRA